jgi:hypothetical protein
MVSSLTLNACLGTTRAKSGRSFRAISL